MTTLITLRSVKGSPLSNNEMDTNFSNLRNTADAALTTAEAGSPIASPTVAGTIKVGSGLAIDGNGVLSATGGGGGGSYVLPTATAVVLGGVKVGSRLSIDGNGVLSADLPTVHNYQIKSQLFTTSGTWTCPAGVTSILVTGAGGGGGGAAGMWIDSSVYIYPNYHPFGGGGGGGGTACANYSITVVPGTVYTITIGAGGAGDPQRAQLNNGSWDVVTYGSNGGTTSFDTLLTLAGGLGGASGTLGSYGFGRSMSNAGLPSGVFRGSPGSWSLIVAGGIGGGNVAGGIGGSTNSAGTNGGGGSGGVGSNYPVQGAGGGNGGAGFLNIRWVE